MSTDVMHNLVVSCGDQQESLGVLIPFGQEFGLDTKLAIKRLGKGLLQFRIVPKRGKVEEYVPLSPEEPFAYIKRLKECYLVRHNGGVYAAVRK
jgi:hypothetical protein